MAKIRKYHVVFLLILIQTFIAVSAGFTALFLVSRNHVAPGVQVAGIDIGGLEKSEASKKIQKSLGEVLENKSLEIKWNNIKFEIKYSDIDAGLDSEATVALAYGQGKGKTLVNFITGNFSSKRTVIPVISFNEGKLREKLKELKVLIDSNFKNSYIYLEGGKIKKVPEAIGYKLNVENAISRIRNEIGKHIDSPLEFKPDNNYEVETIKPSITIKDFKGVEDILSQYSTEILPGCDKESIKQAVYAINGLIIYKKGNINGGKTLFSFNEQLARVKAPAGKANEGYSQVASTLYAAVLKAGIKQGVITRTPHDSTVDYIQPGLDASIAGSSGDLEFENTLGGTIAVLADIKDNKVIVSLLGKKSDKSVKTVIETEVQQRYVPTVINMESQDLQPGQKKLISPGKEGVKVSVYRVRMKGKDEVEKSLLYYDRYKSVEAIVQIGPNTKWYDGLSK